LYLTYFTTHSDGLIEIKGCANSVEDIYVFYNNMKDLLFESKLKISKLDLKSDSLDTVINNTASTVDNAPYIFEITNMDDSQMKSFMDKLSGKEPAKTDADSAANQAPPANTDNNANEANNNPTKGGGLASKLKGNSQPTTDNLDE
jgi:ribosomal protein L12E/L44/L45/RPP1/RPP2